MGMKPETYLRHFIVGLIFAILYNFIFSPAERWELIVVAAMAGALIPDMDPNWRLKYKRTISDTILHGFAIPLVITFVFPQNILVGAFFFGYFSHIVADLDKPGKHWQYVKNRGIVLVIWISSVFVLTQMFGVSLITAIEFLRGY
jgi:hypothetical protein